MPDVIAISGNSLAAYPVGLRSHRFMLGRGGWDLSSRPPVVVVTVGSGLAPETIGLTTEVRCDRGTHAKGIADGDSRF